MSENSRKQRPNFKLGPNAENNISGDPKAMFNPKKPGSLKSGSALRPDRFQRKSFSGK